MYNILWIPGPRVSFKVLASVAPLSEASVQKVILLLHFHDNLAKALLLENGYCSFALRLFFYSFNDVCFYKCLLSPPHLRRVSLSAESL